MSCEERRTINPSISKLNRFAPQRTLRETMEEFNNRCDDDSLKINTTERVRQIEAVALRKIKKELDSYCDLD